MDFRAEHAEKAPASIVVIESLRITFSREEHPENASEPSEFIFLEKEIFSRDVQFSKEPLPMD